MTEGLASMPSTMRAVVLERYGPPQALRPRRVPQPVAGPGDVVVRVRAVAVGRADAHMRAAQPAIARTASGLLRPRHPVMGGDLAGEVVAVGSDVTALALADRVVAVSLAGGGYAELARVPAAAVAAVPDTLSFDDAVAVTEGGLTALPFLRDHGRVAPGTRLLILGAAGGIGVMAVQLGVHMGATVTGVCSARNVDLVRSLGAHQVLDRTAEDFTAHRESYDVVLDAVGASSFRASRPALAAGGAYLTTVPSARIMARMLTTRFDSKHRAVLGFTGLRTVTAKVADMALLLDLAARGEVRAVVDRRYALEQAAQAHAYVDTGRKAGAVLLMPNG